MFQLLTMALLLLELCDPELCKVNIGYWYKTLSKNFVMQTLLDCDSYNFPQQHYNLMKPYSLIVAFGVFTQYMQLYISSSSSKKKLITFTVLMYFLLWVM